LDPGLKAVVKVKAALYLEAKFNEAFMSSQKIWSWTRPEAVLARLTTTSKKATSRKTHHYVCIAAIKTDVRAIIIVNSAESTNSIDKLMKAACNVPK
jgi:hypothetical protein